jgi:hypothetical protein
MRPISRLVSHSAAQAGRRPTSPIDCPIPEADIMPNRPHETTTPPGPAPGGPLESPTAGRPVRSREDPADRPKSRPDLDGGDPAGYAPDGSGAPDRASSRPPRRSTARPRGPAREPIDFGRWDGWDADELDPRASLLQVAANVMGRYELCCSMHGFKMPSSLRIPPSDKAGWGATGGRTHSAIGAGSGSPGVACGGGSIRSRS